MSGHTPGPWKVTKFGTIFSAVVVRSLNDGAIALVCEHLQPGKNLLCRKTMAANARLIAAAPTLLAALEDVVREKTMHGNVVDSMRTVRAAIDLARGTKKPAPRTQDDIDDAGALGDC